MTPRADRPMNTGTLWAFVAIAFGLTWGLAALMIAFPAPIEAIFGPMSGTNPLFVLAVYAPAIAAVGLVWRHHGGAGLLGFLKRLGLWRMSAAWWIFLAIGIPAVFYLGAAFKGTLSAPFPFTPWYQVIPAMAAALVIGPIEEFGWRGLALPLLQRRFAPIWASLVVGVIWALWHIPAFMLSGAPQHAWSFPAFFGGVVAMSVIMTAMFNASSGSLLIAALMHFQANGPAWPDAQPWDTPILALVAVAVVWLDRRRMFDVRGGSTEVVLRRDGA